VMKFVSDLRQVGYIKSEKNSSTLVVV
jgi:hypothetical protein